MATGTRTEVWESIVRFERAALDDMDLHLRDRFGHGLDDYDVLHQLASAGEPVRMGDLADRLLVANSSCTRIVQRLAASGLVERTPGVTDRREVLVSSSPDGWRLYRRMAAVHVGDIERWFDDRLTPDEYGLLRAVFARLAVPPAT